MENLPEVFKFYGNEVRTVERDGEVWFVATDIADILEYRDAPNMTRMLDEDEAATHNVSSRSENGVEQAREVILINESGLYHAIFNSRHDKAKDFRRWVTGEVLPAIRRKGYYSTEQYKALESKIEEQWDEITDLSTHNQVMLHLLHTRAMRVKSKQDDTAVFLATEKAWKEGQASVLQVLRPKAKEALKVFYRLKKSLAKAESEFRQVHPGILNENENYRIGEFMQEFLEWDSKSYPDPDYKRICELVPELAEVMDEVKREKEATRRSQREAYELSRLPR
jgi:prophage antirepressor-like protein